MASLTKVGGVAMARPIEATPVLRGEDAKKFIKAVQSPKPYSLPVFDMQKMAQQAEFFAQKHEQN